MLAAKFHDMFWNFQVSGPNIVQNKVAHRIMKSMPADFTSLLKMMASYSPYSHPNTLTTPFSESSFTTPQTMDFTTTTLSSDDPDTTWMTEPDDRQCSSTDSFMPALPWIRIIFGMLMVVENCVSLVALWRVKRMQHAMHSFISSLAVAELLTGVWCCYRYGAEILVGVDMITVECRLRFVGITYLNFVAILSISALCLDRCVALYFPFRYTELVSKRCVRMALAFVWTFPLLVVLTAYVDTAHPDHPECSFVNIASQRTYIVLTVLRCCLITFIIVSELLIFRSARCQIIKIYPSVFSSRSSNRLLKLNAKAAITILAVVVPFLLLYLPVLLVQGNLAVRPHLADSCQSQLLAFVWLCASAHGLFTPLIFCWRFTEVRQNLLKILNCWTHFPRTSAVFHVRTNDSASTP